jgi:hypothetical protein
LGFISKDIFKKKKTDSNVNKPLIINKNNFGHGYNNITTDIVKELYYLRRVG